MHRGADPDKWIAGFKAHATSKTGTWGYEVPITRAEFVNEEKTRVFKSAMRPSVVGGFMEEVRMEKLGPVLSDEKFQQLTKDLGEKTETKVMKVVTPMPPPPADAYLWASERLQNLASRFARSSRVVSSRKTNAPLPRTTIVGSGACGGSSAC